MIDPRVQGDYEYEDGELHITTDTGTDFHISGDSADGCAEKLGIDGGSGSFDVPEGEWDDLARGSFR